MENWEMCHYMNWLPVNKRTVQCKFSLNYNLTNDTTQRRKNRLGREEEGEQIAFKY